MAIARFDNNPLNGSRWLSATRFERRRIGETILRYRSVTSAIATLRTFLLPLNFLLCVWRARRTVTRRFGLIRLIRLQARRIARADGAFSTRSSPLGDLSLTTLPRRRRRRRRRSFPSSCAAYFSFYSFPPSLSLFFFLLERSCSLYSSENERALSHVRTANSGCV